MARVPDEAIDRMSEINDKAFKLYAYYCRRRNDKTGVCFPSLKTTSNDTGINYTYCSEMRQHLVNKGWIEVKQGQIRPILGFASSEIPKISSEFPKSDEIKSSEFPKIGFGNSEDSFGNSEDFPTPPTPPYKDLTPDNNSNQLTPTDSFADAQESAPAKKAKVAKPSFDASEIVLPESIPPDSWREWVAYRKSQKKKISEFAAKQQIAFLANCHARGQPPSEVIAQSIRNDWQGLFSLKNEHNHSPPISKQDITRNAFAQEFQEMKERMNVS